MEDVTLLVARNLRRLREEKKLSLDKVAELTGVSKSMLGQIERGDSSPTVATVWKIANGLKVSFTTLLSAPQANTSVVHRQTIQPLSEDEGRYRVFPLFPIEEGRRFEVYTIEIDAGGSLSAEAHPEGSEEFVTVFSGELTLEVGGLTYHVARDDAIRFRADRAHRYLSAGGETVRLGMVIYYPG